MPTLMPHGLGEYTLPRLRAVDWPTWVRHAMLWHDGRFARHPRFPFVAFNTIMSAQVNKKSSWLVNRSGNQERVESQLREALDYNTLEGQILLNSIVRSSNVLRGTRPFWSQERRNLEAMCFALKCPHIFLTFSAADLHWDSLAKVMPDYQLWLAADDDGKARIARKNLKENPHIAAWHFYRRFKVVF